MVKLVLKEEEDEVPIQRDGGNLGNRGVLSNGGTAGQSREAGKREMSEEGVESSLTIKAYDKVPMF